MTRVFIVSARRTPFGRFRGSLSETSTVDLASIAAKAVIGHMHHSAVDHVILGNVLSAGQGMNIARQVAINIGLPISTPAFTINMMCGSGMQAALLGAQAIRSGDAHAVLVGGVESMSQSPMLIARPPRGQQVDVECLVDSIECDGLIDTFSNRHMGETAEDLAEELKIGRREQDAWAERSQKLYAMALEKGMFADEIVPVGVDLDLPKADKPVYAETPKPKKGEASTDWLTVKMRYKHPMAETSLELVKPLAGDALGKPVNDDFRFVASVAEFGLILRESPYKGGAEYGRVIRESEAARGADAAGHRAEFTKLVKQAKKLTPAVKGGDAKD